MSIRFIPKHVCSVLLPATGWPYLCSHAGQHCLYIVHNECTITRQNALLKCSGLLVQPCYISLDQQGLCAKCLECCRYGVPGSSARRFEEVMRTTAPQRFEQDRDLLHHLTTLTPPPLLMHNGTCKYSTLMLLISYTRRSVYTAGGSASLIYNTTLQGSR